MDKLNIHFILVSICTKVVQSEMPDYECLRKDGVESRIAGGQQTTIEEHPHMAFLVPQGGMSPACGGSIISRNHILTSARCIEGAESIDIRIGSTNRTTGGQEYTTTVFMAHPMFMVESNDYDVAMVVVEEGMDLNGDTTRAIEVVELDNDPTTGEDITVTGFGQTGPRLFQSALSDFLKEGNLQVVNRVECQSQQPSVTDRMFCALDEEKETDAACMADMGGPAVNSDNLLAGVISFGNRCRPQETLVLTRLGAAQIRSFVIAMSAQYNKVIP